MSRTDLGSTQGAARPAPRWTGARRGRGATLGVGSAVLGLLALLAVLAPWLTPYDPAEQIDPVAGKNRPPGTRLAVVTLADGRSVFAERVERTADGIAIHRLGRIERMSASAVVNLTADGVADRRLFVLGSDRFGRDLFSRLIDGARTSLAVALLAVAIALILGLAVGSIAALGPRWLDALSMRLVDALLAFPTLFLLIALAALFKPSDLLIVVVLGATNWMDLARIVRSDLLGLKQREFVLAARGLGRSWFAIWIDHLLPNALGPVLVQVSLLAGQTILVEAALSYLGLGIQPPRASFGNLIAEGRDALRTEWWLATFPGIAVCATVISFHLLGDGLRDRADPRLAADVRS